ncbi:SAV_915 family protein [Streptomyces sp. NPDC048659]|uniref:SAV_915 family protein n=1 Tax=Streptomyces sp. NPDC048659 TaxID=3155489 RepID=UPI00342E6A10
MSGLFYVPVRPGTSFVVVRMFRTPLGIRTAVVFTASDRLVGTLGPGQPWIRLSEAALRALVEPLGVTLVTIDPALTAPQVAAAPSPGSPSAARARTIDPALTAPQVAAAPSPGSPSAARARSTAA